MSNEKENEKSQSQTAVVKHEPTPAELMRQANDVASVCGEIVKRTAVKIQGRRYVRVEGWEAIATAHGCFAGARDAERAFDSDGNLIGYKAVGEVRNQHGELISTGEGFVGFDEPNWKNRPEYAGRAMAQTRAISRVCRSAFAHVVVLIDKGLSTTPAEEVPREGFVQAGTTTVEAHPVEEDDVDWGSPADSAPQPDAGAQTEMLERWRQYPVPFGQDAGTALEELPRKKLYGWWANYDPAEKGNDPKDVEFRLMLDEAGNHYNFTK